MVSDNFFDSFFAVAAQYLQKYPQWHIHEVLTALKVNAVRGVVTGENIDKSTPNFLLNTAGLRDSL